MSGNAYTKMLEDLISNVINPNTHNWNGSSHYVYEPKINERVTMPTQQITDRLGI